MEQLPLPIGLLPEPTLTSFVAGANTMALDQVARWDGLVPLYLWGDTGSGKTHLLRALCADARWSAQPIAWIAADVPALSPTSDGLGLLVFDDCERMDPARQQLAFAAFVAAAADGVPVASAGRLPPVDLPLRDDLRTRLGGGHVVALQPLDDASLRIALAAAVARRGATLPDDLTERLLTRHRRDMRHLMALIDRLDRYAMSHRRALSVALLRQMLAETETETATETATATATAAQGKAEAEHFSSLDTP